MKLLFLFVIIHLATLLVYCVGYKARIRKIIPKGKGENKLTPDEKANYNTPLTDGTPDLTGSDDGTEGVAGVKIIPDIVGGVAAVKHQFPWQVAIVPDVIWFCGGSVISHRYVLTAAHCVDGFTSFQLSFGIIDLNATSRYELTSTKFIKHQNFDPDVLRNDIAVIVLPRALSRATMNQYGIAKIRLPSRQQARFETFAGKNAIASGWGKIDGNSGLSQTLNYAKVLVITNVECAEIYSTTYVYGSTLCTFGNGTTNICQGDSGGPLQYQEGDNRWTQIGITSFSAADNCFDYPSGFTRVSSYLRWLSKNAQIKIR